MLLTHSKNPRGPVCSDARLTLVRTWASATGIDGSSPLGPLAKVFEAFLCGRPQCGDLKQVHPTLKGPAVCSRAQL